MQFLEAPTLKHIDRVSERYASVCLYRRTSMLAFARPNGQCEVDVYEGRHIVRSAPVPGYCNTYQGGQIVAAGSKIYLTQDGRTLVRYGLADGVLTEELTVELDGVRTDQAIGLGDGRLLIPDGRQLVAYGGSEIARFRATGSMTHLCAGASGRVWYSVHDPESYPDRIVLAQLGSTQTPEATISVAPGRVTHMASDPDGSLAVVTSVVPTNIGGWRPAILLLDPKGAEQRRIVLDDSVMDVLDADLNAAFIALTPTVIVLDAGRHGVFGWNRSTGARI